MAHKFTPRKNTNRPGPPDPPGSSPPPGPTDAPRKQSLRKSIRRLDGGPPAPKPKRASGGGSSIRILVGLVVLLCLGVGGFAAIQIIRGNVPGFKPNVSVGAPTRLDWVFAESHKSETEKPQYKVFPSTTVQYEFFAPPNYDSQKAYPLILFLSADPQAPAGWSTFKKLCTEKGVLFAAPRAVGEGRPTWERIRIVADVLDDVRRNYHVDTDRTYIGGVGNGARMACRVGFALPELFGGVMAFDGADFPIGDVFGQQRIAERLSITLAVPDSSPAKAKVEQLYAAYFKETKTRVNFLTYPGQPGELPSPALAEEIFVWMDEGAADRRKLAEKYPSTRISGDTDPPGREAYGEAFLTDAKKRMQDDPNTKIGIAMVDAVTARWPNTSAASQATKTLQDYIGSGGKSVQSDVDGERRPFDLAQARAIETYLRGLDAATLEKTWDKDPLEDTKSAKDLRDQAIFAWNQVKKTKSSPPELVKEAEQRLPVLEKIAPKK